MSKLRFVFEKTGRARYISHLDLMRTFQRAFNRAGLELKHSEGFNPHPQISVLLPLQLGCESVCERLDADVLSPREGMTDELNRVLPEGVRMISVGEETGSVEMMLERVADRYEADMRALIKRLLSLFEPLIIVLLGLGVGSVVTIMFMAIMDMQGAAG